MAWRSIYAETVKARMDDKTLNLTRAMWTWARLALSRVKAYGNKWYKWYVKQRLWQQKKTKLIPEQYRKYTLIEFGPLSIWRLVYFSEAEKLQVCSKKLETHRTT